MTLPKSAVFEAPPDSLPGIVGQVVAESSAPEHLHLEIDSSPCYLDGAKLGVGSSAAMVAAVASAFSVLGGDSPRLAELYDIHARFQGGGSGLDIAAAVTGGVIRFQDRRVVPARLPRLGMAFVFAGTSTRTADLVARFESWRAGAMPSVLRRLIEAAVEVADCTVNAEMFVAALGEYGDALERLDRLARIGIFGPGHQAARQIAARCGVVYKPCGAGGGDTGVAVAEDREAVARFAHAATTAGLTMIPMEIARDGIRVRT